MEPSVSRSLKEGFKAARRSGMGMVWYAGCWIGVAIVLLIGVMASNPPREVFEEASPTAATTAPIVEPAQAATATAPVAEPTQPAAPAAANESANRDRVISDWFKRSWPLLIPCLLILAIASIWLTGAQTGYLTE